MFRLWLYHEVVRRCMGTFLPMNGCRESGFSRIGGFLPLNWGFSREFRLTASRGFVLTASKIGREIFSQIFAERKRG